jgi:hypothetical protein
MLAHLFYGGNGTVPVDSGLPRVGVIHGVKENGDLLWYRYNGRGVHDPSGSQSHGWNPNSGNSIGNGWQDFRQLLGCGDGVILGVNQNGDLLWYKYDGNGEHDPSGTRGWHPNSGNPIGNNWQSFRQIFVKPRAGFSSATNPRRLEIFGVLPSGDLRWYSYNGEGERDPSGSRGWHHNSGNVIGNGWQNFRHLWGSGGVIFGVHENGNLLWYAYTGNGDADPSGTLGWAPNSGNVIGNGWQGFRAVFGGASDEGGFGNVIYAVTQVHLTGGDLSWRRYSGQGESDPAGHLGWHPNSGNTIGNSW